MFFPLGYVRVFFNNQKQKEAELRKLTEFLHLHNHSLLRDVHRPDPETPNKSSHTARLVWKSQNSESIGNSIFSRDFISSDY